MSSSFPKSVQSGIPKLGKIKNGYKRMTFGDILYEEKRAVKLEDNKLFKLITIKRSRGGIKKRSILKGQDISVQSQFEIKENDFVISKRQIVHGACAIVSKEFTDNIVSNEYSVLKTKDCLNIEYLKYLSYSIYFQQTCFHSSIGVHIEKMIFKLKDWFKWKIDIPELDEQIRIASFLSSIDTKIDLLSEQNKLLKDYKRGVLQQLFSKEIRFEKDDGSKFTKWKKKKLGDVSFFKNGKPHEPNVLENAKYQLITLDSISIEGKLKNKHKTVNVYDDSLKKGDIVVVLSDIAHAKLLGLTDLIPNDNFVLNQRMGRIRVNAECDARFVSYNLNFNQKYFRKRGQGTSQKHIYEKDIMSFTFYCPCKEEQTKIATYLSSIDKKIDINESILFETQEFKKGLLQRLFN